jgi:hypothetical protein
MIFSFCRNVTAKIVVPRPNTVNVFCGKRQKFTRALPTDHTPRQSRSVGSDGRALLFSKREMNDCRRYAADQKAKHGNWPPH